MEPKKERHLEQIREELGKQPALIELWRSQLKIVANRANTFADARKVLEVGCGNGAIREHLSAHMEYSGVDPIWCKDASFDFKTGFAESIPHPNGTFDLVLIKDAVNYFRELRPVIVEASRVLRPAGAIFITEHVGANYRPGFQKAKNLIKKHLHLRRNVWDKTYSNYYTSQDIIKVANRLGFPTRYEYAPSDLRYFLTIRPTAPSR